MPSLFPATRFPPCSSADEHGLLMLGSDWRPETLVEAYRRGIFPWPIVEDDFDVVGWFSPDPRAIIELEQLYVSRRLARRVRSGCFRVTFDESFAAVVAGCAAPRKDDPCTWLTAEMAAAYERLHKLGVAHSVEVWQDGQLVGGLYGVVLGGLFAGESMFSRRTDASKVAMVHLVERLKSRGFTLFDVQQATPHTLRMGATEIPRREFLKRLRAALKTPATFAEVPRPGSEGLGEGRGTCN